MEYLANAKHGRYILSGTAVFCYRDKDWLARITGGKSVAYTLTAKPGRAARYLTASWATPPQTSTAGPEPDADIGVRGQDGVLNVGRRHVLSGRIGDQLLLTVDHPQIALRVDLEDVAGM